MKVSNLIFKLHLDEYCEGADNSNEKYNSDNNYDGRANTDNSTQFVQAAHCTVLDELSPKTECLVSPRMDNEKLYQTVLTKVGPGRVMISQGQQVVKRSNPCGWTNQFLNFKESDHRKRRTAFKNINN